MNLQTQESNYLNEESNFKSVDFGTKTDESCININESITKNYESSVKTEIAIEKTEVSSDPFAMASVSVLTDQAEATNDPTHPVANNTTHAASNEPTNPVADDTTPAATNEPTQPVANDITSAATNEPTQPVANDITPADTNEPTHPVAHDITHADTNEPTHPVAHDITPAATNEPTHPVAHDITPADTNEPTHPVKNITHAATNEPTHPLANDITPAATNEPTHPVANDITHAATNEPTHPVADDTTHAATNELTNQIAENIKPAATNELTNQIAENIKPAATNELTNQIAENIKPAATNELTNQIAENIKPAATNEPTNQIAEDIKPAATNEPTQPVANDVTPSATNEPTHHVVDDTHPSSTMDRPNERSVKSRDFEFWYAPARSNDHQHGGPHQNGDHHQHRGHHQSKVRNQNATLEGNPTSNNDDASGAFGGSDDAFSYATFDGSKGLENDDQQTMNTTTTDGSIEVNLILQEGCINNSLCGNMGENGNTNTNATGDTPDSDTGETNGSDTGSTNVEVPNISVTGSEVGNVCNLNFSTDVTEAKSNSCNDKPNEGLAPTVTKSKHTSTEQTNDPSQSADYVNIQQLNWKLTNTAIVCNASNNIDGLTNLGNNSRVYDKTNDKLLHFETNVNFSDDKITDFPRDANTSCDSGIFTGNFSDVTNASGECEDITYGISSDDTNAEDYNGALSQTSRQASYPGLQGTTAESNTEFKGQLLEEVLFEIQQQREINRKRNEELKRSLEGKIASIPPEPLIFLDTDRNIHYDGHGKVIDVKVIENKTSETNTSVDSGRRTKEKRNARRKGEAHTENNIRQCSYEPVCQPVVMRQTYVAAAPTSTQRTAVLAQQSTQRTAMSATPSTQRTAVSAQQSTQRTAVSAPLSIQRTAVSAHQSIQPAIKSAPQDGLEIESVSSHRQASKQAVLHERNAQIEVVPSDGKPCAGIKQKEVVPHNKNQELSKELKGRKRKYEDMRLRNLANVKTSEVRQLPIHRKEQDESNLPVHRTDRKITHLPVHQTTREITQPLQATAPPWPGEAHDVIQPAPNPVQARSNSMTRLYPVLPTLLEGQEWAQRNTTPSYTTPQQEMSNVALSTNPLSIIHQTTNPQHLNPHILIKNDENTVAYHNFTPEVHPRADCVTPLAHNTGDNYQVWYTSQEQGPMTGQPEDGTPHVFNGKPLFTQGNISKGRSLKGQVPNYLPFSIIATLVCCFPVGAIALCFAVKAKKEEKQGHMAKARYSASRARLFCVIAVLFGLILYAVLLYFVITNVTKTMRSL